MEGWSLLVFLLVVSGASEGSRITFPGQSVNSEGDPCTTVSGQRGVCSQSCGFSNSQQSSSRCDSTSSSLLCCAISNGGSGDVVTPPFVTFNCSKSQPQFLPGQISGNLDGKMWPWMALVGRRTGENKEWLCTGMLINGHWILTTAFCSTFDVGSTVVRLGEYDYADDQDGAHPQDFSVSRREVHPDYTPSQGYHAIMLLRLDKRVKFQRFISPACLPWGQEGNNDIAGTRAAILSFANSFVAPLENTVLREIELTVFPTAQCDRSYSVIPSSEKNWPQGMGDETLCAGDPNGGKDACVGDVGGPLMTVDARGRYVAGGVISSGYGCGKKDFPGVYVNLRHSPYLKWIKETAFTS